MNDEQKKVSSAIGMKRSVETSELLQRRIACIPEKANKMQQAIIEKDFKTFAELTMKDSNQMHAVCLDTYPPCTYMNDISHSIADLIHLYNDAVNDTKVWVLSRTFLINFLTSTIFLLPLYIIISLIISF